jgi:arylformamidase
MSAASHDPVYRGWTQAELDFQYNNRAQVADAERIFRTYEQLSEEAHNRFGPIEGITYGPDCDQVLDWFKPKHANGPIAIFVHGGAWQAFDRRSNAFPALGLLPAGCHVVVPDFGQVPRLTLEEMVKQIADCVLWVRNNAAAYRADPRRIALVGHSSGAHLCAAALTRRGCNAAAGIRGAALISGLYDLEPVRLSYRNKTLGLTEELARKLSPVRGDFDIASVLHVAWSERDTVAFKLQSREFSEMAERAGVSVDAVEYARLNHYDIVTTLADPDHPLTKTVARMLIQ